jgi:Uma2 family endonuclease
MLTGTLVPPFGFRDNDGPGGWVLLFEPELHLDVDVMVPDLAGWRRERMPDAPTEAAIELAPDWVCEILSPSTARIDRVQKMPAYARHGVSYLWLLDPITQTLEVFALDQGHWMLLANHGGNEVVRAVPFDAVELRLERLWG